MDADLGILARHWIKYEILLLEIEQHTIDDGAEPNREAEVLPE